MEAKDECLKGKDERLKEKSECLKQNDDSLKEKNERLETDRRHPGGIDGHCRLHINTWHRKIKCRGVNGVTLDFL